MTAAYTWQIDQDANVPTCYRDGSEVTYVSLRDIGQGPLHALIDCVRDADKFATLVYGLRDLHCDDGGGWCHGCDFRFPCNTIRLVDELAGSLS